MLMHLALKRRRFSVDEDFGDEHCGLRCAAQKGGRGLDPDGHYSDYPQ